MPESVESPLNKELTVESEAVQRKVSEMCTNGPTQWMDVFGLVEI